MNSLAIQPKLIDLYRFIDKVNRYPVSVGQLLNLARQQRAPKAVIDFYKSFDQDQVFRDEDELTGRSEQVDIMRQEEADMPREDLLVPEED
jgi:hypothetical protein